MKQRLGGSLGSGDIQSLQKQQMADAVQVGKKGDQGECLVRGFIPVACVGCRFPRLRVRVDDGCAFHALVINNPEVGAVVRNGQPRDCCRPSR